MSAKVNGPISWNFDSDNDFNPNAEYEKKYAAVLTELAKYTGAACNCGDAKAFEFILDHAALIFQAGFEVLKESVGEVKKSKNLKEFMKKMSISNN